MKEGEFAPQKINTTQDIMRYNQNIDPLVSKVIAGNQDAFIILYKKYFPMVKGVCFDIVKNPDTANDLAQNVFMKLPESIKSFKGESTFSTWLHRVAVNEALMHLRKKSVKTEITTGPEVIDDLINFDQTIGAGNNTEEEIISKIAREKAIEKLPQGQKVVYLLSAEGYGAEEIAKKLSINVGVAKKLLFHARHKLRELLS